jgi:hypothetical protein
MPVSDGWPEAGGLRVHRIILYCIEDMTNKPECRDDSLHNLAVIFLLSISPW